MTFYVNAVHLDEHGWNESCVGLFDNNEWAGRGSFCGWYGQEFYLNTTLVAYGVQRRHGGMSYNPKAAFDGGFLEMLIAIMMKSVSGAVYGNRK